MEDQHVSSRKERALKSNEGNQTYPEYNNRKNKAKNTDKLKQNS